jgi:NAD(P)-dependent dehydrogenase (short-subunit alcohol dehydrogenase family)
MTGMRSDAQGKVALVTGANRGIGLEVCRQLAAAGVRVVLTGRDRAQVEVATARLRTEQLDVSPAALDVTDRESIRSCARQVLKQFGRVDILVNNAAVLIDEDRELLAIPIDHFRSTFEANVFGAVAVSQAFVPGMMEGRAGSVVNVSSGAGQLSSMGAYAPAYSISKAALNAFTVQLAAATRGTGVIVNCVDPGWVRTRMGGRHAPTSVEDGADTVVWLALRPSSRPTGKFFSKRRAIEW